MKVAPVVLLCLVIAVQPVRAASSGDTLLAEMEASLHDNGAGVTVQKYLSGCSEDDPAWRALEGGGRRGIDLILALGPGMDGCVSETVNNAMALAMVNNPEVLLSYYSQHPDMVLGGCAPDFWEGTTKAKALASLAGLEKAVRRVHDKTLLPQRDVCLRNIASVRAQVRNGH